MNIKLIFGGTISDLSALFINIELTKNDEKIIVGASVNVAHKISTSINQQL